MERGATGCVSGRAGGTQQGELGERMRHEGGESIATEGLRPGGGIPTGGSVGEGASPLPPLPNSIAPQAQHNGGYR